MDLEKLAEKAEQARRSLIELAAEGAKIPGLRLNLLRSIELLQELAMRARGGGGLAKFEGGAQLSAALPGGLKIGPDALPALREAVTPVELVECEISVRRDLARKNGSKGGSRRTPAQIEAFAKAQAARAARISERRSAAAASLR